MGSTFRLALIQLGVGSNKSENLARAVAKVADAARYPNLAPEVHSEANLYRMSYFSYSWFSNANLIELEPNWCPCQNASTLPMELRLLPTRRIDDDSS